MMRTFRVQELMLCTLFAASLNAVVAVESADAAGNAQVGARLYQACSVCHSLAPGRHFTGPTLAGIWGRQAGAAEGFIRYSPALAGSRVVWDESTLDRWLANPEGFIPGNLMPFNGMSNAQQRADLIAFLQAVSEGRMQPPEYPKGGMGAPDLQDLKYLGPEQRIAAIRHCKDSYFVTTEDGEERPFWENNFRFITDSTNLGPPSGRPVLMASGSMGDRALAIFAAPQEISAFIRSGC